MSKTSTYLLWQIFAVVCSKNCNFLPTPIFLADDVTAQHAASNDKHATRMRLRFRFVFLGFFIFSFSFSIVADADDT